MDIHTIGGYIIGAGRGKEMKRVMYIAAAVIMLMSVLDVSALGRKERPPEGPVLNEEVSREIEVYQIHPVPGSGSGVGISRPQGQALWYLFQGVRVTGGKVQVRSNRQLTGPIISRERLPLNGDFQMTRFVMKVEPAVQFSYRNPREVEVRVKLDELISNGRIVLQPAQRAVIKAAGKMKGEQALIRARSVTTEGRGRWTAVVEIADAAN